MIRLTDYFVQCLKILKRLTQTFSYFRGKMNTLRNPTFLGVEIFGQSNNNRILATTFKCAPFFALRKNIRHVLVIFPPIECSIVDDCWGKKMGIIEIFESRVPCLSDILDLQRTCQKNQLKFSTDTNRYLLYLTLKKVGPFVAQKLVSKCKFNAIWMQYLYILYSVISIIESTSISSIKNFLIHITCTTMMQISFSVQSESFTLYVINKTLFFFIFIIIYIYKPLFTLLSCIIRFILTSN